MASEKYKKYILNKPRFYSSFPYHNDRAQGFVVYLDSTTLKDNPAVLDGPGWRGWNKETKKIGITQPNPITKPHAHPYDQLVVYIGSDPDNPQDLGSEIEFTMGDEIYNFNKSAIVYVPKGVMHTERHITLDRPYLGFGFELENTGEYI